MEKEFVRLINKHNGIIHKICNVYFNGNPNREDYYQEILVRLWRAFPGFENRSMFSTWMYRVALNAAIDIIRKLKIQPVFAELTKAEYNIPTHEKVNEPAEKERLYYAINQLTDSEKAIIILYLEDFSYKEIAEIIGISESNTGVKINRIKKQLTNILNGDGKT